MGIIINIGNDESNTKIQSNNDYKPCNCWYTTAAECPAMNQDKDAVSSNQAENGARCPC